MKVLVILHSQTIVVSTNNKYTSISKYQHVSVFFENMAIYKKLPCKAQTYFWTQVLPPQIFLSGWKWKLEPEKTDTIEC